MSTDITVGDKILFEVPEGWLGRVSLTLGHPIGTDKSWTISLMSDKLPRNMTVAEYGQAQGDVLRSGLSGFTEARFFEFETDAGKVPIREYSWKSGHSEVAQCQAYLAGLHDVWTLTFTAPSPDYNELRQIIPDLIRSIRLGKGV